MYVVFTTNWGHNWVRDLGAIQIVEKTIEL